MTHEVERALKEGVLQLAIKMERIGLVRDRWWRVCYEGKEPFVVVALARTYATVELDTEPTGRKLTNAGVVGLGEILQRYPDRGWTS
jgi:hypothetical protein